MYFEKIVAIIEIQQMLHRLYFQLKELNMKKFVLIALTAMTLLSACNTVSGVGKDVKAAGNAVSGSAESAKSY